MAAWQNVGKLLVTVVPSDVHPAAQVPCSMATLASRCLHAAQIRILVFSCLQVKTSGNLC